MKSKIDAVAGFLRDGTAKEALIFSGDKPGGDINNPVYEVRRAAELIEYSKKFDVVIDLHRTKTDSGIITIIPYIEDKQAEFNRDLTTDRRASCRERV